MQLIFLPSTLAFMFEGAPILYIGKEMKERRINIIKNTKKIISSRCIHLKINFHLVTNFKLVPTIDSPPN